MHKKYKKHTKGEHKPFYLQMVQYNRTDNRHTHKHTHTIDAILTEQQQQKACAKFIASEKVTSR